ncbi:MAG: hypothetical protein QXQ14_00275 [Candidatus Aenigmatarchaeota archaeon]
MVRKYKKVENKCAVCGKEVGKFKIEDGKVEIVENKLLGTFVKLKGKAHLKVICKLCQKDLDKKGISYLEVIKG